MKHEEQPYLIPLQREQPDNFAMRLSNETIYVEITVSLSSLMRIYYTSQQANTCDLPVGMHTQFYKKTIYTH